MLQISADGLKSHIFPGNRRNAADRSTDAPAYDFSCWGRMLTFRQRLTADHAKRHVYAGCVSQEPICEALHAASMPRRNAGVLNAFDLLHQKNRLGALRIRSRPSLSAEKRWSSSRSKLFQFPISIILVSSTAASRDPPASGPSRTRVSVSSWLRRRLDCRARERERQINRLYVAGNLRCASRLARPAAPSRGKPKKKTAAASALRVFRSRQCAC